MRSRIRPLFAFTEHFVEKIDRLLPLLFCKMIDDYRSLKRYFFKIQKRRESPVVVLPKTRDKTFLSPTLQKLDRDIVLVGCIPKENARVPHMHHKLKFSPCRFVKSPLGGTEISFWPKLSHKSSMNGFKILFATHNL